MGGKGGCIRAVADENGTEEKGGGGVIDVRNRSSRFFFSFSVRAYQQVGNYCLYSYI